MFYGLGEERTKLRKKKRKKLIAAKSEFVRMTGYLRHTIKRNIFCRT